MNASKLMKVTYFDPKSDIRLLCYADTVVWDTKPAPTLIALRFGGYPERVQGLADAIYGGATIEIEDDNATYSLMTLPKQYRREVSRDGVYAEATLIAEDDGQSASRPSGKKEDTAQEDAPSDEEFEQVEQDLPPRNTYGKAKYQTRNGKTGVGRVVNRYIGVQLRMPENNALFFRTLIDRQGVQRQKTAGISRL